MFSRFLTSRRRAALTAAICAMLFAIGTRETLRAQDKNVALAPRGQPSAETTLFPGGGAMPPPNPVAWKYDGNAHAIAAGKRLYDWYNCAGCHFHGAGGIGPSLADDVWIYGGRIDQIYDTIARGRPNGMPSWQGKLPENEIWEIAAYVRSLSAPEATHGGPGETPPQPSPPPTELPSPQAMPQTLTGLDK